jgi:hypothetical protein
LEFFTGKYSSAGKNASACDKTKAHDNFIVFILVFRSATDPSRFFGDEIGCDR